MLKLMQPMNNRITTLKTQNSTNHPTGTSSLKTAFIKNSVQHIYDQFVVTTTDKANENVAFICKHFYTEVLIKYLDIDPNGVSTNNDNIN